MDMFISGGEHGRTIYSLKEYIIKGAYDAIQPDLTLSAIGV